MHHKYNHSYVNGKYFLTIVNIELVKSDCHKNRPNKQLIKQIKQLIGAFNESNQSKTLHKDANSDKIVALNLSITSKKAIKHALNDNVSLHILPKF